MQAQEVNPLFELRLPYFNLTQNAISFFNFFLIETQKYSRIQNNRSLAQLQRPSAFFISAANMGADSPWQQRAGECSNWLW